MATNISKVDYLALPKTASSVRGKGEALTRKVKEMYTEVGNLHANWYGKRYNDLATAFNKMKPQLREMQELIQTSIPVAMETISNNYSMVDRGQKAVNINSAKPAVIADVVIKQDVGMRFQKAQVEASKVKISKMFDEMKNLINDAESIIAKAPWKSDDAEQQFKTRFKKLKLELNNSFDKIKADFDKSVKETIAEMDRAEKANTVQQQ